MLITSPYLILYGLYILCGVMGAFWLRKHGPHSLIFWSVAYIAYSTLPSAGMIMDSRTLNIPAFELIGQSLLIFFAVIGGALFSSAWNELRAESRNNANKG